MTEENNKNEQLYVNEQNEQPDAINLQEQKEQQDAINLQMLYNNIDPLTGKKKRGRKPKALKEQELKAGIVYEPKQANAVPKKRGRKPKGGKIIEIKNVVSTTDTNIVENVILHLEYSLEDLDKQLDGQLEPFYINDNKKGLLNFKNYDDENETDMNGNILINSNNNAIENDNNGIHNIIENDHISSDTTNTSTKQIWKNIKILQKQFHINGTFNSKKASCFFCTCDFSNPPIHIPQKYINKSYQVYGNFCSPECSVAFLMNEHIDSSQKFERYQLLNYLYGKVYNYTKSIKPAPNPYYLLDKYYGNLTIQEYRKCFDNERLLFVIDKPLTKIMPEIIDEGNDLMSINNMSVNSNSSLYQIKRKTNAPTVSKADILSSNFGF